MLYFNFARMCRHMRECSEAMLQSLWLLGFLILGCVTFAGEPVPSFGQLAWQRRELEIMLHFGPNTFTGQEWGSGREGSSEFRPARVDCEQWCSIAKSAGARGVVFTAKHHDGFCLWPSAFTDHSVRRAPWKDGKGDVVRELAEACRRSGLKLGLYLSPADRHEPTFGTPAYNEFYLNQLRELLTQYGEISEVWMDGAFPDGKAETLDFPSFYKLIRELQPNAVIVSKGPDVRWAGNEMGVAREAEWSVLPIPVPSLEHTWPDLLGKDLGSREKLKDAKYLHWYPAVANRPLNHDWFWDTRSQQTVRTLGELKQDYANTVGRNAGFLLNICPNRDGIIPQPDAFRLRQFGDWLLRSFTTNRIEGAKATVQTNGSGGWAVSYAFPSPVIGNTVVLGEDITQSQRVEKFTVEGLNGGKWRSLGTGLTIGWKRILKFRPQVVEALRVQVTESRAIPVMRTAEVYTVDW